MPKMKTNRAAAKRFSKTGKGKFRRRRAGHKHGMISKTRKHNRRLRAGTLVRPSMQKRIQVMLPYL